MKWSILVIDVRSQMTGILKVSDSGQLGLQKRPPGFANSLPPCKSTLHVLTKEYYYLILALTMYSKSSNTYGGAVTIFIYGTSNYRRYTFQQNRCAHSGKNIIKSIRRIHAHGAALGITS